MRQIVQQAKSYYQQNQDDKAIDHIYEKVNYMFRSGQFEQVDQALAMLDPRTLPTLLIISILTITFAAKHKLQNRTQFFQKSKDHLTEIREKDIDALLGGLD